MPFPTTRWSLVLGASRRPASGVDAGSAFEDLCRAYWKPLFVYLRRSGMSAADAEDAVQGFLSSILSGPGLRSANPQEGRFRSYLLGALRHHVSNARRREQALKRGGGQARIELDASEIRELPGGTTPEDAFAHAWAIALLERVRERLRAQYADLDQLGTFEHLEPFVTITDVLPPYAELAQTLGVTEGAVRVAVHRLRTRFRTALRREVGDTVASDAEIDDELRAVVAALETGR